MIAYGNRHEAGAGLPTAKCSMDYAGATHYPNITYVIVRETRAE